MANVNIKLGLGLIRIGRLWGHRIAPLPTEKEAIDLLYCAFDSQVNFYDTAPSYGLSEERLGKFLRSLTEENRKKVTVATKFGEHWSDSEHSSYVDHSFDALRRSVDRSLSLLGYIDVLQVHKATPQVLSSDDLYRALEYAKSCGITAFGASVSDVESGILACNSDLFSVIQMPYNEKSLHLECVLDLAKKQNKLLLINRPFCMGEIFYRDRLEQDKRAVQVRAFEIILQKKFHGFVLSGTGVQQHLRENITSFHEAWACVNIDKGLAIPALMHRGQ